MNRSRTQSSAHYASAWLCGMCFCPALSQRIMSVAKEMVLLMRFASEGDLSRVAPSGACFEELQAKEIR